MNYLLIENKGELDINSLILMGASTKREDDTMVGFFGSGNKYAISLFTKNGVDFSIFSGSHKIDIDTKTIEFRGTAFNKIIIDGMETSLTTDMGPKWDTWMAIREFVCNAIDEKQYNFVSSTENVSGREGYTRIYIPHIPEVKEVINNWDKYFAFDRTDTIQEKDGHRIFKQNNDNNGLLLYRKGVRCYRGATSSLYQYDFPDFEINESRIIESTYDAGVLVVKWLARHACVEICRSILGHAFMEPFWEGSLSWYFQTSGLDNNWREAIGNAIIIVHDVSGYFVEQAQANHHYYVTKDMARIIKHSFPDVPVYGLSDTDVVIAKKKISTTPKIEFLLKKANEFFGEVKYNIVAPIEVVEFSDKSVLGCADEGKIQLSEKVFDKGVREVVLTILEENTHIDTGYADNTRCMQEHLFNLLLKEKEERYGYFL